LGVGYGPGGGAGGKSYCVIGSWPFGFRMGKLGYPRGDGAANGGGGGSGESLNPPCCTYNPPGSGGSGTVVIQYPSSFAAATSTTGSPTVTVCGGYRKYVFTGSGSIRW
jgi:hypothetical protein